MSRPLATIEQRRALFWAKVDKHGPFVPERAVLGRCWLWTASTWQGYGRFQLGRPRRPALAHRVAYEEMIGPIPQGKELDHLCRVRRCVRPSHCEPVTRLVNIRRGMAPSAVNRRKTSCVRGHLFDEANTLLVPRGRSCRACHRERQRLRYRSRRKVVAA